jgi:lipopolysaccharide biosynthesis glycosyltransferase/tetratricopeptide (TPR) repeat protein
MTVAAFFRDARVQGALAGDRASPTAGLLEEFFSKHNFAQCTPQQLLALSDLALRCGDQAVARDALDRTVQSGQSLHLAFYKLGRLAVMQNDLGGAARFFHLGTEAHEAFPFNWMGEARALHAQGLKDAAVVAAERFMRFGVRPHAPAELATIADLGDYLFDAGQRRRCQAFYEFVLHFGAERPRDAVRLADVLAGFNEHAAAQSVLLAQEQRGRLDNWGQRTLALSLSQTGQHDKAIDLAEAAMVSDPSVAPCLSAYLDVLARAGDTNRMRDALLRHVSIIGEAGVQEIQARVKMAEANLSAAAADLAAVDFSYQSRLYHLSYELAYAALASGQLDVALAVAERLGRLAPEDNFIKLLLIEAYFRVQMWEQAGDVLASMTEAENERPHVILKRFEHACFTGNTTLAEDLCAQLVGMELPTRQFVLPILRFLAERQRWNDVVDRALPWLDRSFNFRQIGYVLFRAAKYTCRHADMIGAVEALEGWAERPDLVRLRASLALDLAADLKSIEMLSNDPTVAGDIAFRRRIEARRGVLAAASVQIGRRALLLCSDRNYLCATFVALFTIMPEVTLKTLDVFIVVDDDLVALGERAAAAFITAGVAVTILGAATVVPKKEKPSPDYGVFTSGHRMAVAAFYRIYAAKYLHKLGVHDRVAYVDSDILLRGRFDPLFVADLKGQPLAAKLEPSRPEVLRAIKLHGLEEGGYFNSGVLVFDLRHAGLLPALQRTTAAIKDGTTTLLFHDQCALNLGFRGAFAELHPAWNTIVTETTRLAELAPDAVVLHFLERPKPWSAAYGGEAGLLWFERWRETAAFMGEAVALELFAMIED